MSTKQKVIISGLSLSALAFVGLIKDEGFTENAVIPTKNDRPTNGFGSTFDEQGRPIKMGDKVTPVQAVQRSLIHIQKDETRIKQCVTAPLSQSEYDTMVNFAYQYGTGALCNSIIVKAANAGDYARSCRGYLEYYKAGGFDCRTPGNKVCSGVWKRSQERYKSCMEAQ